MYTPLRNFPKWPAPIRYMIQTVSTTIYIARARPSDIFFTNPPAVAGLVVVPLAYAFRARAWSDSHSGAFNNPRWMRFARLNDWVMRHCAGVLVTNMPLADIVSSKKGHPFVLNMVANSPRPRQTGGRQTILAPLSYAFDEPVRELLDAVAMAPEIHLTVTGAAPEWVAQAAPANCTLTGWLSRAAYESLLSRSSGVVCLTNRDLTMQMSAFEALEYGIPMLVSGTAALRAYLNQGGVIFVDDHSPQTLAVALRQLWHERERYMAEALAAQGPMFARAKQELAVLHDALDCDRTCDQSDKGRPQF